MEGAALQVDGAVDRSDRDVERGALELGGPVLRSQDADGAGRKWPQKACLLVLGVLR